MAVNDSYPGYRRTSINTAEKLAQKDFLGAKRVFNVSAVIVRYRTVLSALFHASLADHR